MKTYPPSLFACKKVTFEEPFTGRDEIKVLASTSHAVKSPSYGSGAAVWVESANKKGFTVCVLEFGDGSNGTAQVNWIALQSAPHGSQFGTTSFNPWTAGTECKRVAFQKVSFKFLNN